MRYSNYENMLAMSHVTRRGSKLAWAVAAAGAVGAMWAIVHVSGMSGGPRMINVGSSTYAADAVAISPDGKTLFAANGDSDGPSYVTLVNLATGQAGKRIDVGGPVWKMTATPDGRTLYALIVDSSIQVARVNLATGRAGIPIRFQDGAADMVESPDGTVVYLLAGIAKNSMAVIPVNVASGRQGREIPVPVDSQVLTISPDGRTLYIGAGDLRHPHADEVIPLDTKSGKAGAPIAVPRSVRGLAVSPDGGSLYVLAQDAGCYADAGCTYGPCSLIVIDAATGTAARSFGLSSECEKLAVAPGGNFVYVLNGDETITPVELGAGQLDTQIRTGSSSDPVNGIDPGDHDFTIAPDGRTAYVGNQSQGVAVIPLAG